MSETIRESLIHSCDYLAENIGRALEIVQTAKHNIEKAPGLDTPFQYPLPNPIDNLTDDFDDATYWSKSIGALGSVERECRALAAGKPNDAA